MTLTNVSGTNQFCGPAVVASIAGITTDEAEDYFRRLTGRRIIKGVTTNEIVQVLSRLGFNCTNLPTTGSDSIFKLLISQPFDDGTYIFMVSHHVVILQKESSNWFFLDNHTKKPINAAASARLGQRVLQMIRVWK